MYKISSIFSFSIFVGLKIEKLFDLDHLIKGAFLQFAIRVLRYFTDLRMVLPVQIKFSQDNSSISLHPRIG